MLYCYFISYFVVSSSFNLHFSLFHSIIASDRPAGTINLQNNFRRLKNVKTILFLFLFLFTDVFVSIIYKLFSLLKYFHIYFSFTLSFGLVFPSPSPSRPLTLTFLSRLFLSTSFSLNKYKHFFLSFINICFHNCSVAFTLPKE